ncbi:MAG: hypothetical protein LBM41_05925 [Ruminococcus sp.]|jgi:hypothetical protein|nr:hypothetical protein [Ruminococcus sp.]
MQMEYTAKKHRKWSFGNEKGRTTQNGIGEILYGSITKEEQEAKKIEVRPYEEVKKRLDKLANETVYKSSIEFSERFKPTGTIE